MRTFAVLICLLPAFATAKHGIPPPLSPPPPALTVPDSTGPPAPPSDPIPSGLPLVQAADLAYVGSFRLPTATNGTSRFGYGGYGVAAYNDPLTGQKTLFIGSHPHQEGHMAQVRIPDVLGIGKDYSLLPAATWVQPFANAVDGSVAAAAGISTSNGNYVYGTLVHGNRLLLAAGEYYGCTQQRSHGYSTLDLRAVGDFRGFSFIRATANVRSLGGPMATVPAVWRASLGGAVIGGMFGTAIVGCQSAGPALTVFNPDSIGFTGHTGSTVAFYPLGSNSNHALCSGATCSSPNPEATTNDLYNLTTRFGGLAFPSGTRSVLVFGRHGMGTYCYGLPTDCGGDPAESDAKGPHAFPYRFQVWAYDANDLMRVRSGALKTWEVRPYAYWGVDALSHWVRPGYAKIRGAGYDPESRRLFVTTDYGERPRVDVFQVREF